MMPASHEVWDDLRRRWVGVCDDHAELARDGRLGRRFDGSRPYRLSYGHGRFCVFPVSNHGPSGEAVVP